MNLVRRDVFWRTVQEPGFEHLSLGIDARDGVVADGLVIGVIGEPPAPFRLRYRIACDAGFAVHTVAVTLHHPTRRRVALRADQRRAWHDAGSGAPLPHLDGCTAVDVMTTPFSNTLPVRMLAWQPGASRELDVAYVSVPDLGVVRDRQRYTCLAQGPDGARFRVASVDAGWEYEVGFDRDGLVVDYADLFARVDFSTRPSEAP